MSFATRKINLRFILGANQGVFDETGNNAVDLTGLRCELSLVNTQGVALNQLDLTVYGMTLSLMNKLTILQNGLVLGIYNQILVTAGQGDDLALIFSGHMLTGYEDFSAAPESAFVVKAYGSGATLYQAPQPLSYKGAVAAATIAGAIARTMVPPLALENDGVTAVLHDVNLPGDPITQLRTLAKAARFSWTTDDAAGVLAIYPQGKNRESLNAVKLTAQTGLVGYPAFNDKGAIFSSFFNPNIKVAGKVQVTSVLSPVNGVWYPYNVHHDLQSEVPDGRWFTHIEAQRNINEGSQ